MSQIGINPLLAMLGTQQMGAPQDQQSQGLNEQGYGAAGVPLSPNIPRRPWTANEREMYGERDPMPGMQTQVNPLTGILEAVPTALPQGQRDPRRLWQVQQLEQALDHVNNAEEFSPQQKQFAASRLTRRLNALDPMQQYRRSSLAQQMTPMENYVSQMLHIDKENGFAMALDSKGQPHFHKLEDNRLQMQKEFESHKMEMQQKLMDAKQAHEQHVMDMREKQTDIIAKERERHHKEMESVQSQLADLKKSQADERSAAHKDAREKIGDVVKRLTRKEVDEEGKPTGMIIRPTKQEILDEMKRDQEIMDELGIGKPAGATQETPYEQAGPPQPKVNPFVPSTQDAFKMMGGAM